MQAAPVGKANQSFYTTVNGARVSKTELGEMEMLDKTKEMSGYRVATWQETIALAMKNKKIRELVNEKFVLTAQKGGIGHLEGPCKILEDFNLKPVVENWKSISSGMQRPYLEHFYNALKIEERAMVHPGVYSVVVHFTFKSTVSPLELLAYEKEPKGIVIWVKDDGKKPEPVPAQVPAPKPVELRLPVDENVVIQLPPCELIGVDAAGQNLQQFGNGVALAFGGTLRIRRMKPQNPGQEVSDKASV